MHILLSVLPTVLVVDSVVDSVVVSGLAEMSTGVPALSVLVKATVVSVVVVVVVVAVGSVAVVVVVRAPLQSRSVDLHIPVELS